MNGLVTTYILGTSAFASNAITSILNESERLSSKVTTFSSSSISTPMTDNSLKSSVIAFTCLYTDSLSLSLKLFNLRLRASLLDQVFFWNWSASFFHTVLESSGLPSKYNNVGTTKSTIITSTLSRRATMFRICRHQPQREQLPSRLQCLTARPRSTSFDTG